MARTWTDEQKARQASLIRSWMPWRKSTGPRTTEGKAVSAQNVLVGQARKAKALEQAKQELNAALAKIHKLTRTRKNRW